MNKITDQFKKCENLYNIFDENFFEWWKLRKDNKDDVSCKNISRTSLISQITILRGELLKLRKTLDADYWWCRNK